MNEKEILKTFFSEFPKSSYGMEFFKDEIKTFVRVKKGDSILEYKKTFTRQQVENLSPQIDIMVKTIKMFLEEYRGV